MIYVTKTFLPPIDEYIQKLHTIWSSNQITNQGNYCFELEDKLKDYLKVKHISLQANGTLSLQLALRALDIRGEIITTPFSYVATTNSIIWEGCTPVFVDIESNTFCINPELIRKQITPNTKAILATHVYGIPCNVKAIQKIADEFNLKIIYDAAHAFGVEYENKSILNYGDISTLSFHATKLFHTAEGGATVCGNPDVLDRLNKLKTFGHRADDYFGLGINAKMSELHAAMGLTVLPYVNSIIENRKLIYERYMSTLSGSSLIFPNIPLNTKYNYSYFPVFFKSFEQMQDIVTALKEQGVFPRRYFYPSLNKLPHIANALNCPVSESFSQRVLALPMHYNMSENTIDLIASIVLKTIA